ncbi:MAG TPA: phospholipid carrier-dependent glycosyltransferase [Bryobacteraceae bacterium]|nr:phospholipid carrier-dependent glycosyltransferase [Bryobacteraceae bacterium]
MTGRVAGLAWKSLVVAAAAFAFLAYDVQRAGVASTLADPVSGIHAQDESLYANAALRIAAQGNWLTPIVMGRIYLNKPPLLYIFTALSLKALGISLFAVRLPSLLAGSLAVALVLYWGARTHGLWAGLAAMLLLLSNSAWFTFSRLCYTDTLLAFWTVAALLCLQRDPRLDAARPRWGFIACTAAAILTKSFAGVIPIIVLAAFSLVSTSERRPALGRMVQAIAWIALLIAPWHLYQMAIHRAAFWDDYVSFDLIRFQFNPPVPRSPESTVWFYLKRLFLTDPFLCVVAALGLPALFIQAKKRQPNALLVSCWLAVEFALVLSRQWKNSPYILILIAPLCLAAGYIPLRLQPWLAAALLAILGAKLTIRQPVWSLAYSSSRPLAAAPLLRSYAERGRPNELILVDPDDEFYDATIPLAKFRYCFRDPDHITIRYAPQYVNLGITVSSAVFDDLDRWEPVFRERLRAWGLDSSEPIATSIVADSDADVLKIIQSHPASDFYVPANLMPAAAKAAGPTHESVQVSPDRAFLLARISKSPAPPASRPWYGNRELRNWPDKW